ncbi:MAG TPA: efflux RND transporter periplasmic adaptor subunit [Candidatus Dormibacteraeota bacterium]|nr:efflux RND transporter periplasmic adaptor subunit [Candidatus Dormibacteraeota bacterium]
MRLIRQTGGGIALLALAGLAACGKSEQAAAPPPMDVQVVEVVQQDVLVYQEWIGTLTGYINAVIRPQVKGYLLKRAYDEGQVVQEGQLLFQIDPREFQAQLDQWKGALAQAQAALGKTQLDVARYTPLAREGAVSQQELDNAVQANQANLAAVDSAKAQVEQAQLNLGWTKVTAPIAGVAGIAIAQVGDLVDPTTQLTTVSQLDPIKAVVPVSEQEYLRYASGQARAEGAQASGKGALELYTADGQLFPERGTVSVVGREVDPRTGTITLEALFPNPRNVLRPGGYAKVRAVIESRANALVIPQRAVQDLQGQSLVALVGADDVVEMRPVRLGPTSGTDQVVLEGLAAGDRVIAEGLQKVRGGTKVAPRPWTSSTPSPKPAG